MKGSLCRMRKNQNHAKVGQDEATYLSSGSKIRMTSIVGLSAPPERSSTSLGAVGRVELDVERSGREVTMQGHGELESLRGRKSKKRRGKAL